MLPLVVLLYCTSRNAPGKGILQSKFTLGLPKMIKSPSTSSKVL